MQKSFVLLSGLKRQEGPGSVFIADQRPSCMIRRYDRCKIRRVYNVLQSSGKMHRFPPLWEPIQSDGLVIFSRIKIKSSRVILQVGGWELDSHPWLIKKNLLLRSLRPSGAVEPMMMMMIMVVKNFSNCQISQNYLNLIIAWLDYYDQGLFYLSAFILNEGFLVAGFKSRFF